MTRKILLVIMSMNLFFVQLGEAHAVSKRIQESYVQKGLFSFRTIKRIYNDIKLLTKKQKITVSEAIQIKKDLVRAVKKLTGIKISDRRMKKNLIKAIRKVDSNIDVSFADLLFDTHIKKSLHNEGSEKELSGNLLVAGMLFVSAYLIGIIPLGFPPAGVVCWPVAGCLASTGTAFLFQEVASVADKNNSTRKHLTSFLQIPEIDIDENFDFASSDMIDPIIMEERVDNFSEMFNIYERSIDLLIDVINEKDVNFNSWYSLIEHEMNNALLQTCY